MCNKAQGPNRDPAHRFAEPGYVFKSEKEETVTSLVKIVRSQAACFIAAGICLTGLFELLAPVGFYDWETPLWLAGLMTVGGGVVVGVSLWLDHRAASHISAPREGA
jgi:hypothetical protein